MDYFLNLDKVSTKTRDYDLKEAVFVTLRIVLESIESVSFHAFRDQNLNCSGTRRFSGCRRSPECWVFAEFAEFAGFGGLIKAELDNLSVS